MSLIIKKKVSNKSKAQKQKHNRLKKLILGKSALTGKQTTTSTNKSSTNNPFANYKKNNYSSLFWDEEEEEINIAEMIETAIKAKLSVSLKLRDTYNYRNLSYIMTFKINDVTKEKTMKNLYIRRSYDKINKVIPYKEFNDIGIHWEDLLSFLVRHNSRKINVQEFFQTIK